MACLHSFAFKVNPYLHNCYPFNTTIREPTQHASIFFLSHLFASVEQPLSLRLNAEELRDSQPQLIHLSEFGQRIDPVGLLAVHSAHLDPHCSSPTATQQFHTKIKL